MATAGKHLAGKRQRGLLALSMFCAGASGLTGVSAESVNLTPEQDAGTSRDAGMVHYILGASPIPFPYPVADRDVHRGKHFKLIAPEEIRLRAGEEGPHHITARVPIIAEQLFAQDYSLNRPAIAVRVLKASVEIDQSHELLSISEKLLSKIESGEVEKSYPEIGNWSSTMSSDGIRKFDSNFKCVIYLPDSVTSEDFIASIQDYASEIDDYCQSKGFDGNHVRQSDQMLAMTEFAKGQREVSIDLSDIIDIMITGEYELELSLIYYETRGVIYTDTFERGNPIRLTPDPPLLKTRVADTARIKVMVE